MFSPCLGFSPPDNRVKSRQHLQNCHALRRRPDGLQPRHGRDRLSAHAADVDQCAHRYRGNSVLVRQAGRATSGSQEGRPSWSPTPCPESGRRRRGLDDAQADLLGWPGCPLLMEGGVLVWSGQVEPVQVHDLVPGGDEVVHELLPARRRWRRPRRRARSSEFEPKTRSARLPVHLTSPVRVAALEGRRVRRPPAVHVVPRSSRLTKKSFVSVPGVVGEHAERGAVVVGAEHAQAADQHGHLRRAQRRAGSPGRPAGTRPAAGCPCRGSCGSRRPSARARRTTRRRSAPGVASVRPGRERHLDLEAGVLARPSRPPRTPPSTIRSASETCLPPRRVEGRLDALERAQHRGQLGRGC